MICFVLWPLRFCYPPVFMNPICILRLTMKFLVAASLIAGAAAFAPVQKVSIFG